MAYIPDAELHEIFLQNLDSEKILQQPQGSQQMSKCSKEVKYGEIFESFKKIQNPQNSSFEEEIFYSAQEKSKIIISFIQIIDIRLDWKLQVVSNKVLNYHQT